MNQNTINIESKDTELIESFNRGNHNAFNFIVRKYQKKVYWIIRKMVLDHDDTDDLTQEVFIKLYKSLNEFRGDSQLFTYIYRIAMNLSLNHINKNKKIVSNRVSINEQVLNIETTDNKFEYKIDNDNQTKLLKEAIENLPDQQRAVFNLRFYENLSYEEISKILNRTVGGLKANYFHAVKNIGSYLKRKEVRFEI